VVTWGRLLFVAAQLPIDPATDELVVGDVVDQAPFASSRPPTRLLSRKRRAYLWLLLGALPRLVTGHRLGAADRNAFGPV